jgi:hypothetical protein
MKAALQIHGLTFHWPDPRKVTFLMPGFFLLSILVHALTFYVFQIVYPPYVSITPPPMQVRLLTPDSPEHAATLRWIESEDPALLMPSHEISLDKLLPVPYRPSFATSRSLPKSEVEEKAGPLFPPVASTLEIVRRNEPRAKIQESAGNPVSGIVRLSDSLARRATAALATSRVDVKSANVLEPAHFLLGVNDRGEVRFVFLEHSSGDKVVDERAGEYLRGVSFAPVAVETTWGFVTFLWGSEAYGAAPQSKQPEPAVQHDPR